MIHHQKKISVLTLACMVLFLSLNAWGQAKPAAKTGLININTAGVKVLSKLPRIGEKTAERIIKFRSKNGKFKRIQDLMKVKGIGEKTFKKMEKMITV